MLAPDPIGNDAVLRNNPPLPSSTIPTGRVVIKLVARRAERRGMGGAEMGGEKKSCSCSQEECVAVMASDRALGLRDRQGDWDGDGE